MNRKKNKKVWMRLVPLEKATRDWDVDFWQAQSSSTRFWAAWRMVKDFYKMRGKRTDGNALRLQRTVERFKQA